MGYLNKFIFHLSVTCCLLIIFNENLYELTIPDDEDYSDIVTDRPPRRRVLRKFTQADCKNRLFIIAIMVSNRVHCEDKWKPPKQEFIKCCKNFAHCAPEYTRINDRHHRKKPPKHRPRYFLK